MNVFAKTKKNMRECVLRYFTSILLSWFEPIWAPDKQANVFMTWHLGIKTLNLVNQHFIFQIFSEMTDVFTPKRISPDYPFKSNKRRFWFWLHGVQFKSVVCCTIRRLTSQCDAEIDSICDVQYTMVGRFCPFLEILWKVMGLQFP